MKYDKRLLLLVNAKAGKSEIGAQTLPIIDIFVKGGYSVTVHTTQYAGELTDYVLEHAHGYDTLVSCGGDGTLNETVNALMRLDSKPTFGYIPTGTVNDFATSLGIPKDMVQAAHTIISGEQTPFDVGCFEGKYFAYVAAFGAFTDVSYETPQHTKNIIGRLAYVLEGAKRLPSLHSTHIKISYDGKVIDEDVLVGVISNSSYIAGLPVGQKIDASIDDGLLEVTLIRKPQSILDLQPIINSLLLNHMTSPNIITVKAKKLDIVSAAPLPWTLDGEYGGVFDSIAIENIKHGLSVMTPSQASLKKNTSQFEIMQNDK